MLWGCRASLSFLGTCLVAVIFPGDTEAYPIFSRTQKYQSTLGQWRMGLQGFTPQILGLKLHPCDQLTHGRCGFWRKGKNKFFVTQGMAPHLLASSLREIPNPKVESSHNLIVPISPSLQESPLPLDMPRWPAPLDHTRWNLCASYTHGGTMDGSRGHLAPDPR